MGHLVEKYNSAYFLGGLDTDTGRPYAVLGHAEFCAGKIHPHQQQEFAFTSSLAGSLKGKDVLEIGFGRGDFIPMYLDADVATYTGIDFSRAAVQIAQAHFRDPRVRLIKMEATDLEAQQAFDVIALYDTLEHIPVYEMETVWQKIRCALRPKGYIVLSTPIFDNPNAADHSDQIPAVTGMHCHKQTWGTLARMCLQYNFTIARVSDRVLGAVRTEDLCLFDEKTRMEYQTSQSQLLARCGVSRFEGSLTRALEKQLVPGAGRVAIGCVAENHPKYLSQALRLVQSIRWFGGSMAGANCFICGVDDLNSEYVREFERLGVFVRVVPRFSRSHGHSNKLRLFELPEMEAYDTVILLDCDTVVVQDPWPFLNGEVLQAKIADTPTVPHDVFQRLFQCFGLPLPAQEYQCNPGTEPTIWYCNAGVLVFPKQCLQRLTSNWRHFNQALLERLELLEPYSVYCDQASLALAFAAEPLPFQELPLSMNFPLHHTHLTASAAIQNCDPVILHYHDRVDASGYLLPSPYSGAQKRIEQFNQQLHQDRRYHFNNRLFWDFRYGHAPELGSGRGSRGTAVAYKQELLRQLVETHQPQTILDVGCGDQVVSECLTDQVYTGVDVSSVVIERNQASHPHRRFICSDVLDLDSRPADLLLCLDMLIHIDSAERYRAVVNRLIELTGRYGLVAGFEAMPQIEHDITFYHEPLSETLQRAGARHLSKIGAYREVTLWFFEPPVRPAPSNALQCAAGLEKPVFIIGCMRTGTTVLADLLGGFEGIVHCPFELDHLWSELGKVPMASPKTRDTLCPELGAEDVQEGQAERLAHAFREEMRKNSGPHIQDAIFLTKNPHLCNKLPFVHTLFPQARFIWICRQLPLVVASLKHLFEDVCGRQQTWHYWPEPRQGVRTRCWEAFHFNPPPDDIDPARCFPGGHVQYLAEYWLESNEAVGRFFRDLPPAQRFVIQEEALVHQPETQLARCLAFLGLPLSDLSGVKNKLDSSRNQLWTSRLTPDEQISLLEFIESRAQEIEQIFAGTKRTAVYLILDALRRSLNLGATLASPDANDAATSTVAPIYEYNIEGVDCEKIYGWVWDKNQPDTPLQVDIYDGDVKLSTIRADGFREDLMKAGKGNGKHGFFYTLPANVTDWRSHTIQIKLTGTKFYLE